WSSLLPTSVATDDVAAASGPVEKDQLQELVEYARRLSPHGVLVQLEEVDGPVGQLGALAQLGPVPTLLPVHPLGGQPGQAHVEGQLHLGRVGVQDGAARKGTYEWGDARAAGHGGERGELAQDLHRVGDEAELLGRLPQG